MNVEAIPGFLEPGAATALARHAADQLHRRVPGHFVEVGSFQGKSTVALASVLKLHGDTKRRLIAVDPHECVLDWTNGERIQVLPTQAELERNLVTYGVRQWVDVHVGTVDSLVRPEQIALAFVDGLHDVWSVLHDAQTLLPAVVSGGLLLFHDYCETWPGVVQAVDTLCQDHALALIEVADTLAAVRVNGRTI